MHIIVTSTDAIHMPAMHFTKTHMTANNTLAFHMPAVDMLAVYIPVIPRRSLVDLLSFWLRASWPVMYLIICTCMQCT
jgi:hypothetical protein